MTNFSEFLMLFHKHLAKTRVSRVITVEPNSNNEIENNKKRILFLKISQRSCKSGTDKIPTKLVKLASNFVSKPLATAICQSLVSSKFPDIAKVAAAIPIDKKTDGKSGISSLTCKFIKLFLKNL